MCQGCSPFRDLEALVITLVKARKIIHGGYRSWSPGMLRDVSELAAFVNTRRDRTSCTVVSYQIFAQLLPLLRV